MTNPNFKHLTLQEIDELITLALDNASRDWYLIDDVNLPTPKNFTRNDEIKYDFMDKVYQGSNLEIYDLEDQETKLGDLNVESIKNAINILKNEYTPEYYNIKAGFIDEEEADTFFQLCIMKNIVFI
jgi:hypothetical protein